MKHVFFSRALIAGAALAVTLGVAGPAMAHDRDNNPPGWRGGPGASPDRRWHGPHHHWVRDRDDNPPGPRGGPGTNWENPPSPRGGLGASPDRRWRWWR